MTYDEKIKRFAQLFESDRISNLSPESLKYDFNISNCKVVTYPGKKYTKVDCNGSGVYMVDNSTGEIFGIKAYGVPHKGHRYGTLDTITCYYWGGYRAVCVPARHSIEIQSADEILKARGTYKEPEKPIENPEKVFTSDKYEELLTDLSLAAKQGYESSLFVQDSGTCNLDGIFLTLPRFNEEKTLEIINKAGVSGFKMNHNLFGVGFLINPPNVGQAYKRETAAKTMYKALKAKNYDVSQWQQMD